MSARFSPEALMAAPIPVLGGHSLLLLILQLAVLLLLALLLGRLASLLKMPAIVGELLAGVVLGPSLAGWLTPGVSRWLFPQQATQVHLLDAVGQVGLILLVGMTGMQMDVGLVRRRSRTAARISLAGMVVPLAFGIGAGFALSGVLKPGGVTDGVFALFVGVAMCVTAIPVISKTLMDMNLFHHEIGQLTVAAAIVDDAFGWFMLSVVSALATGSVTAVKISTAIIYPILFAAVAVLLGRPFVRIALSRAGDDQRATTTAIVLVLLAAAATQALGLEAIFGAFVCGAVIGSCDGFNTATITALRPIVLSFLAPVYFTTAGLRMNLRELGSASVIGAALLVLLVAVAGKFIGAYVGARMSRLSAWEALALGASMNARGIVEVVVATVGLQTGVLSTRAYTIVILVAVLTSVVAPPILRVAVNRIEDTPPDVVLPDAA
jgi:Kef-type K+ transport system membrane component KefB